MEVVVRRSVAPGREHREPLHRRRPVALQTDRVARRAQNEPVRVVAVRTAHARRVHAALDERSPDVDLVLDLPVRVVQALVEPCGQEIVEERTPGAIRLREALAPGVAAGAGAELGVRTGAKVANEAESGRVRGVVGYGRPRRTGRRRQRSNLLRDGAGQVDVRRAGSVARLTADVDGRPGGAVRIAVRVVVRTQMG